MAKETKFKKMDSKKLLTIPICFALVIPLFYSLQQEPPLPEPFFADGKWFDPLIPEICVEPLPLANRSEYSFQSGGYAGSDYITRYILLAGDQEFTSYAYETPDGNLDAFDYAILQIGRASKHFEDQHDTQLRVVDTVTWHSDETDPVEKFDEAIDEIGYSRYMVVNSYSIDFLIAYTADLGVYGGIASPAEFAVIVRPFVYWADENIVQHEISHLYGAEDGVKGTDCWSTVCIMSYHRYYTEYVWEDGDSWYVGMDLPEALLTNNWAEECYETVHNHRFCPGGGC